MKTKIKKYRKERGLTQQNLADLLSVRQNTVCLWEKGKRNPSIQICKKLADIFGVSVDELISE